MKNVQTPKISPIIQRWHPDATEREQQLYTEELRRFFEELYRIFERLDHAGALSQDSEESCPDAMVKGH